MAIRTVGAAGDYPFTQAGVVAAIAACSTDDTVRLIDAGTITLASELSIGTRITIEGDPALLDLADLTTLPKFFTAASIRAMDLDVGGISVKNLQFEGFPIDNPFGVGGAINAYASGAGGVGTLENLLFIDCVTCLQECIDGTERNIHAVNCGRLVRDCYGLDMAVFSIVQAAGYNYAIDAQWDKWSRYRLGAIYQPYYNANDRAIRVLADAGQPGLIQNVSAYRAGGWSDSTAFTGDTSYCTAYGYATVVGGGGVDDGNNFSRDPLFTDPANGDFTWQVLSADAGSGTSVVGITTDAIGEPLPAGLGWPRGPYGLTLGTTVSSITVVNDSTIKLNLAGLVTSDATWVDAGNYAITPSGGAAAVSVVSAAVTDAGMSITLTTSEHTAGGAYDVAWTGLTDVADGSDAYTGQGVSPTLSSATVTTNQLIRVNFSEAMSATGLSTAGNYVVTPVSPGGPAITVSSATPGGGNTYVDLVISLGLAGKEYTVTADAALTDSKGNAIGTRAANYTLQKATLLSMTRTIDTLVITLSAAADPAGLATLGSWSISRQAPLFGATPTVSAVALDSLTAPTVVTLTTTNHTNGQNYRVTVASTTGVSAGYLDYAGVGVEVTVTVDGFYFPNSTAVAVWDADTEEWVSALSVTVVSDMQITAILPYYATGTVTRIRVSAGTRHGYKSYTYP